MGLEKWVVHPDIRQAETLPGYFYKEQNWFEETIRKVFIKSWHWLSEEQIISGKDNCLPISLLPGVLDEPLILTRDKKGVHRLLSNVCTHRGKVIIDSPGRYPVLSCRYHGRCFGLDGQFRSMPCFESTLNFPGPSDHLNQLRLSSSFGQMWGSISPFCGFEQLLKPMLERLNYLPLNLLSMLPVHTKDYALDANWALYIDNYLEGFHIPYIHPELNRTLNMDDYKVELFPWMSLQLGIAKEGEVTFKPPADHCDSGKNVFAYYWWVYPNLLFNFYPWGLSLNLVEPVAYNKTRIRFRAFKFEGASVKIMDYGLDRTEIEDEEVVLSVQQGIQSRFYHRGKYSPTMEAGVHHFHHILTQQLFD